MHWDILCDMFIKTLTKLIHHQIGGTYAPLFTDFFITTTLNCLKRQALVAVLPLVLFGLMDEIF